MAPTLYTGSLNGRKTKVECTPTATPPESEPTSTAKPKRVLSEETKQKLAEARERKKAEKKAAEEAASLEQERLEKERMEAEAAAAQKKEAAAAKRREARLKKKGAPSSGTGSKESTPEAEPPVAEPKNKKRKSSESSAEPDKLVNVKSEPKRAKPTATATPSASNETEGDSPPSWFTKYVTDMLSEKQDQEGVKVTKKEMRAQGMREARNKWEDKFTRDRVRNAVDGHMGEMYSMIFA